MDSFGVKWINALFQGSPQGSRGPRSLHQEMECDDDDMMQVMSDMQGTNGANPIVMEAKAVYKQLRTLCGTLKNSHDDDSGLHSDLSLGSMDNTSASQPSDMGEGAENFRQGMLSSAADDLMRSIMALDAVHFKAMLDQSRTTASDQEEELRRRQDIIMEMESKVGGFPKLFQEFPSNEIFSLLSGLCHGGGTG